MKKIQDGLILAELLIAVTMFKILTQRVGLSIRYLQM